MQAVLVKILQEEDLSREEASYAMDMIMAGQASAAQIAGFLIALRQKGETVSEVAGFVESMRRHSVKISLQESGAVDGCGTGGDGAGSFNVSTAAALVAASAGAVVAKHGNRSVSSQCGSADLLEAAGGKIDGTPASVERAIAETNFGFMFAPLYHPAMKHAATVRRELGVRTVFNILGPMTSPAGVKRQVVGVYERALLSLVGEVLEATGSVHVIVAHSRDGLDEFSVSAITDYYEYCDGKRVQKQVSPEDAGLRSYPEHALTGGDAKENLRILSGIMESRPSAYRDATLLNAGALLVVAGKAGSLKEGVAISQAALDSGASQSTLKEWIRVSCE